MADPDYNLDDLRSKLQRACYLLHMCNGVFVPGNDGACGINADFLRECAEAGLYDQTLGEGNRPSKFVETM